MSDKMSSEQIDHLNKLREERIAREKARIEKLREMNLKKYNKNEPQKLLRQSVSSVSVANRSIKNDTRQGASKLNKSKAVNNNFCVNGSTKRPVSRTEVFKKPADVNDNVNQNTLMKGDNKKSCTSKSEMKPKITVNVKGDKQNTKPVIKAKVITNVANTKILDGSVKKVELNNTDKNSNIEAKSSRKSIATTSRVSVFPKPNVNAVNAKKSMQPTKTQDTSQVARQSVFERLYKPKMAPKVEINNTVKLQTDPNYLKKVIKDSNLILNKRHTVFEIKKTVSQPVRRSISAVHLKRISKNELSNCIHKWASMGEKLNKVNLNEIDEDDCVQSEVIVSAVKSERKKVKFITPVPFNTPKSEELQSRLWTWLRKHGKSLDSFHHLQCFGIHHLNKEIRPLNIDQPKFDLYDDENKENVPLESDSDDDSYTENMNQQKDETAAEEKIDFNKDKWRKASYVSDSPTEYNESTDTITSNEIMHHVDEVLLGALNDLTELLRQGFDWEQCARWLRAIRDRFPSAPDNAAYWECRAALEERRGDIPAYVECWEEAIAKGTEHSVVEASLDQMLDKFLQLQISPTSGRRRQMDSKMVDVKNVFKSTIIRFAVQQAKLRHQTEQSAPKFTVTPVRRSARLSTHSRTQTPLRICTSVKEAYELGPAEFRPNRTLNGTP